MMRHRVLVIAALVGAVPSVTGFVRHAAQAPSPLEGVWE
jgi:hypothetical protein